MKFGEAVEYFNPLPANVFVVSEGGYSSKGSRGVKKGECAVLMRRGNEIPVKARVY